LARKPGTVRNAVPRGKSPREQDRPQGERSRSTDSQRPAKATVDSTAELKVIRSRVRRHGLTIRSRPASRGSQQRLYSVLDRATGQVIWSGLKDLVELKSRLWWILRQRRLGSGEGGPSSRVDNVQCPACGTPRSGAFRYCRKCGFDWEEGRSSVPAGSAGPVDPGRPSDARDVIERTQPERLVDDGLVGPPDAASPAARADAGGPRAPSVRPTLLDKVREARPEAGQIVLAMILIGLVSGAAGALIAILLQH